MDPLITAMIGKLPERGPFSGEARAAWLKMMAMAFDVAYGHAEDMPAFLPSSFAPGAVTWAKPGETPADTVARAVTRQAHAGHDFYIAADGTACNADGVAVLISDVPADEVIFDYRPVTGEFRDRDSIAWADGARGTTGLAPGCSFCGPG